MTRGHISIDNAIITDYSTTLSMSHAKLSICICQSTIWGRLVKPPPFESPPSKLAVFNLQAYYTPYLLTCQILFTTFSKKVLSAFLLLTIIYYSESENLQIRLIKSCLNCIYNSHNSQGSASSRFQKIQNILKIGTFPEGNTEKSDSLVR